jgi:hypothetical protein
MTNKTLNKPNLLNPLEVRLSKLPELERESVEAMIVELCQINEMGRAKALDIIYSVGQWMQVQKRVEQQAQQVAQ